MVYGSKCAKSAQEKIGILGKLVGVKGFEPSAPTSRTSGTPLKGAVFLYSNIPEITALYPKVRKSAQDFLRNMRLAEPQTQGEK